MHVKRKHPEHLLSSMSRHRQGGDSSEEKVESSMFSGSEDEELKSDTDRVLKAQQVVKRRKTKESPSKALDLPAVCTSSPLAQLIEELAGVGELRYSQDEAIMYGGFCELLEELKRRKNPADFLWLASEDVRQHDSPARQLVDSGAQGFNDLSATHKAIAVTAAVALGSSTLQAYVHCASDVPKKDRESFQVTLAAYLSRSFGFPEIYALWLAENLQHLKEGSGTILAELDPSHLDLMRFSTVTSLNGRMDIDPFTRALKGFSIGMSPVKKNMLEVAVRKTIEANVVLTRKELQDVLT